ncbi:Tigger transposable element-derived protein 2 [Chionoecetes opilio]|uniref:Tigger transposable element-derived protein 2 n=1 Tax=Chionoecetes opilio TaxID=41210 RepID=A0A8J4Y5N5_CHIOP|nr:Tigger transposable element-derived protein 2 [Chionoecetes opilio]
MPPKKHPGALEKAPKRKRVPLMLKKDIIEKFESGTRVQELARLYGGNHSTISTLMKQKEEIKKADTANGRTTPSSPSQRPPQLEEVEKLLRVDRISKEIIREKALKIFHYPKSRRPMTLTIAPTGVEDFKASRGWFTNFRRRAGLQCAAAWGGSKLRQQGCRKVRHRIQ